MTLIGSSYCLEYGGIGLEGIQNLLEKSVDVWYISLPVGVFLVLAAKYVEKLAIFLAGFVLGAIVVFPLIEKYVYPFLKLDPSKIDPTTSVIIMIVVGILTATVCYAFYRSFVFILGALLGFALSYYLLNLLSNLLKLSEKIQVEYLGWGIIIASIAVALLGGFTALKKETEVVMLFSIIVGSALTSFVALSLLWIGLSIPIPKNDWKFLLPFIILFLLLIFAGMKMGERKSSGG